jgi:uncharacterized protein
MGDEAWRDQPKRMAAPTAIRVAEQLGAVFRAQGVPFSVVLHGGEPLLLGRERLAHLLESLRGELPTACGLHVQTNGVLLTNEMLDVLAAYDVGISISVDGPAQTHDEFRIDLRGRGTHARVLTGIERLRAHVPGATLFSGVLAVIDPRTDPATVYEDLKTYGAPGVDVLVRDGNWDMLPFGKASPESIEYGRWLCGFLDAYLADPEPLRVRLLDDMLRLLLGGRSQKEGVGQVDYGIIVIEPDGSIQKNDTLKVAHAGADRFATNWNVHTHALEDVLVSEAYAAYHAQQRPSAEACLACPELAICGGGMVAHRWSRDAGYSNPTIFCADQKHLIAAMRRVVARLTPTDSQSNAA